ncbi:hypothetical protein [Sphingobium sp. CCH11-B1]|uniref:hypothetical protein n=1 Tax=Sphingobium sp. CCH11-B1 TaxID=1768781 RepID=UPI0018D201C9|nr:hypothetical protein [Sphingobium sp. CCH11-B1]MEA3388983.1 hypothetical protein [Pseudomonadota bacterium]
MRIMAMLEDRAALRRARIAEAMRALGVEAEVEGEAVRARGAGLLARWMRDLGLREAGRDAGRGA